MADTDLLREPMSNRINILPAGLYMGYTNTGNPTPPLRGKIRGWTRGQLKRQEKWLRSVRRDEALSGYGYAITLTVLACPPSAADFHKLRRAYIARLKHRGMERLHWVIEWQERGTPHLHIAAYWLERLSVLQRQLLLVSWLEVAQEYAPGFSGQHIDDISDTAGWFGYMSKHASRGLHHYQRGGIPDGWESSGRLWGYVGDWPTVDPIEVLTDSILVGPRLRRLAHAWDVAQVRNALVRAQRYGDTEKNLRSRRRALVYARRSNRVAKNAFPFPGIGLGIPEADAIRLVGLALDVGGSR